MKSMQVLQDSSIIIREGSGKITLDQKNAKEKLLKVSDFIKTIKDVSGEISTDADSIADSTDHVHSLVKEMFNSVSKLTEE